MPLAQVPEVESCVAKQKYIVNHVQYLCLKTPNNTTLFPVGCAVTNSPDAVLLNRGSVIQNDRFIYQCDYENATVKYRAISCMFGTVEIAPGSRLKAGKTEYVCSHGNSTDYMILTEKKYLHSLCSLGHVNASLVVDEAERCPGISTTMYQSDFGTGSIVFYDIIKLILIPSNREKKN
uniref:Uncharacterized protein n=1 Tax=Panagrolaimus sp. JU765 TaxID=591449 RepID=A0AC34R0B9_9BILA